MKLNKDIVIILHTTKFQAHVLALIYGKIIRIASKLIGKSKNTSLKIKIEKLGLFSKIPLPFTYLSSLFSHAKYTVSTSISHFCICSSSSSLWAPKAPSIVSPTINLHLFLRLWQSLNTLACYNLNFLQINYSIWPLLISCEPQFVYSVVLQLFCNVSC